MNFGVFVRYASGRHPLPYEGRLISPLTTKKENVTTRTDTQDPFDAAVAAAEAEIASREDPDQVSTDAIDPLPEESSEETEVEVGTDQAPSDGEEQVEEVLDTPEGEDTEDSDELLGDLELDEDEVVTDDDTPEPELHTLPGIDEPVTTEELRNGYLRQSDYTRKTQEVAAEKARLEKAESFYKALTEHPGELAKQLAIAAGLIEEGAQPVKVVDLPFRSEEDIQAEVDQKVAQALNEHPEVQKAQDVLIQQWIDAEFAELEQEFGKPLGQKSRRLILETADRSNTNDLKLVARALVQKQQDQARKRGDLKKTAPAKPTGPAHQETVTEPPADFKDAAADAAASLGIELDLSQI